MLNKAWLAVLFALVGCLGHNPPRGVQEERGAIDVGDFTVEETEKIYQHTLAFARRGDKVINYHINSFGGLIYPGTELIQRIGDLRAQYGFTTICDVGFRAYSMGFIFLNSDACDFRRGEVHSTLMIHKGSGPDESEPDSAALMKATNAGVAELICAKAGCDPKKLLKRMEQGAWFMSAEEAIKNNFLDGIREEKREPPCHYPEKLISE